MPVQGGHARQLVAGEGGEGPGKEGGESGSRSKGPDLLRRKTAWGVQPWSAWEPQWVWTVYTGHPGVGC